ncbi:hypothetical protein, partial [Robiginitalea sp.]|uniref:hypothetical protein n=1 Tax=Robiginitalea sp. TaxID=1902411 RepID=UPI003C749EC6
ELLYNLKTTANIASTLHAQTTNLVGQSNSLLFFMKNTLQACGRINLKSKRISLQSITHPGDGIPRI